MDEEAPGPTEESLGFSISEDLIQSISQKPSQTVALEFNGLLNPPVSLQTLETECGGQLWPAGMVLAEYLLKNEKDGLKGKSMFVRSSIFTLFHSVEAIEPNALSRFAALS